MRFGPLQLAHFKADEGAYSIVTPDERKKSQITLTDTDGEAAVAIKALGRVNIPRLAATGRKLNVSISGVNGSEVPATLAINFPKARKDELRIYRNVAEGFNYEAGDVWYVFSRGKRLFVGSMPEFAWRALGRTDADDEEFIDIVDEVQLAPVAAKRVNRLTHYRSPDLAVKAIVSSGYRCEYDPTHSLFISRVTLRPFLEPHHLVPVSLGAQFIGINLDLLDNIIALCPWCHRAVHHAEPVLVRKILSALTTKRAGALKRIGLSELEVHRLYNAEVIV